MSNVGAQNRFLQSNLTNNGLASETTLKNVCDKLESGLTVSGSVSVSNLNDPHNIQTSGLTNKVQCAINATDVTGNLPVAINSVTITDVDNGGSQTTDLDTTNPSIKTAGVDTYTENTTTLSLVGGVRVDSPTSGFPVTNNNEIAPLCLNEDGSVYTSCREFPSSLVSNSNLKVNVERIAGQGVPLGNGANTNCQRVVIANDNDDVPVQTNVEYAAGDSYTSATSQGILMMAVDEEKAGDEVTHLRVDNDGNLHTSIQDPSTNVAIAYQPSDNLIPIAAVRRDVPSSLVASNDVWTIPLIDRNGKLWVQMDRLRIDNPHLVFSGFFNNGTTEPDTWSYTQIGGTGTNESYNSTDRTLDITTTLNDGTDFEMATKKKFRCYGTNNLLVFTIEPNITNALGHDIQDSVGVGMYEQSASDWGFQFFFRGDDSNIIQITAKNTGSQITQGFWNISNTIQASREEPMVIYFEFNQHVIITGEIYQGVKYPLHEYYVNDPREFHLMELPIFIRLNAGSTHPAWTTKVYNVQLIQDYKPAPRDIPFQNNYCNYHLRTDRNDGTPVRLEGGTFLVNNGNLRQASYGMGANDFYDLPTDQTNDDMQISCDNNSRTTQMLVVTANQVDGTQVKSNPVTLNGETAVNIVFPNSAQVYRIVSIVVISNTMDADGDYGVGAESDIVYISPQGQSLSSGVPDAQIMATMALGLGLSKLGYLHVPPNHTFVPLSALLMSNSASTRSVKFAIQAKSCSSDLWMTIINTGYRDDVYLELASAMTVASGTDGYDFRIIVSQGDGSGSVDDVNIIVNAVTI